MPTPDLTDQMAEWSNKLCREYLAWDFPLYSVRFTKGVLFINYVCVLRGVTRLEALRKYCRLHYVYSTGKQREEATRIFWKDAASRF